MRGLKLAQMAWDNMEPPGYSDPDYGDDCDDGHCGECRLCAEEAKVAHEEGKAEEAYEARRERWYGF